MDFIDISRVYRRGQYLLLWRTGNFSRIIAIDTRHQLELHRCEPSNREKPLHNRNQRESYNSHQNGAMKHVRKAAFAVLLCGIGLCSAWAQQDDIPPGAASTPVQTRKQRHNLKGKSLNSDERLAVLASALDSKTPRFDERDCSHLVHAIYSRAGFPYGYADSDDLYDGVAGFQRVSKPEAGDLIVWHGHAGIVVRPSRHVFYSFLHAGPGIDDYTSRYWRGRGEPHFFRYVKSRQCENCTLARKTE